MKHKHADVLIAIAEGKAVQWKSTSCINWKDARFMPYTPIVNDDLEWRIKPEPKPDAIRFLGFSYFGSHLGCMTHEYLNMCHWENRIKLTFDGETGKLKSAEVIS